MITGRGRNGFCQMVDKPGSVMPFPALVTIHLERLLPAVSSNLPGHDAGPHLNGMPFGMSLHGFAPDGAYRARSVARRRCALTTPFHPYHGGHGGIFSVALSLGLPSPGVTRHPDPVEPDFPLPFTLDFRAAVT